MRVRPAAPAVIPDVSYRRPLFDRPLGRYTAEWDGPDGRVLYSTVNRVQDWEGNWPSLYSVLRLPYVLQTYLQGKRSAILPKPVPFLVLDAIKRLDKIVRPGMKVLEIGGGNSTLWFLGHGATVTSFDHDSAWVKAIEQAARGSERLQITIAMGQKAVSLIGALPDQSYDLALLDSTCTFRRPTASPLSGRSSSEAAGWFWTTATCPQIGALQR